MPISSNQLITGKTCHLIISGQISENLYESFHTGESLKSHLYKPAINRHDPLHTLIFSKSRKFLEMSLVELKTWLVHFQTE